MTTPPPATEAKPSSAQFAASALAPTPRTLLDILRATAAEHPSASALDDGTSDLSYAELVVAAEQFAARLHDAGVGRGDTVGVRIPSGTNELYIAILGVLTAGAAYVPVDADDPDERDERPDAGPRCGRLITRASTTSAPAWSSPNPVLPPSSGRDCR